MYHYIFVSWKLFFDVDHLDQFISTSHCLHVIQQDFRIGRKMLEYSWWYKPANIAEVFRRFVSCLQGLQRIRFWEKEFCLCWYMQKILVWEIYGAPQNKASWKNCLAKSYLDEVNQKSVENGEAPRKRLKQKVLPFATEDPTPK